MNAIDKLENSRAKFFNAWTSIQDSPEFYKVLSHELTLRLDGIVQQLLMSLYLVAPQYISACKQAAETGYFPENPKNFDNLTRLQNETLKLSVTFNAFYIFMRSLQDYLYCGLLECERQNWGDHSSMAKAIAKCENPYGAAIRESIPTYEGWLKRMRDLRNSIKSGSPAPGSGFNPQTEELTLSYVVKPQGKKFLQKSSGINVGLNELAEALDESGRLLGYLENKTRTTIQARTPKTKFQKTENN